MAVTGTGIDLVEIDRFSKIRQKYGERFLQRHFTGGEIDDCSSKRAPDRHFAGRLAAKEAVFKALKMKWIPGFSWRDIAITAGGDAAPCCVVITGETARHAHALGLGDIHISISYSREFAVAVAIAQGGPQ